jgi:predicted TIM-barrel fold metal-dependent hydrolase
MPEHQIIDVDGHVWEPDELWEQYLPPELHARRPRIVLDDRGTTRYEFEGRVIPPGTGPGAWAPEGMREASVHRDGAVNAKLRLEDMDLEGIDVAVLYGAFSLGLHHFDDRPLVNAACRAYNDWLADYCAADPNRLKGTPALPLKWIDDSLVEAERCVRDLGFPSITVPCAVGDRNPEDPANFPLYELAQDLDVPLGFHAGGVRFANHRFVDNYAQLHVLEFPFNNMFAATTIVCSGLLERFPRLRVALLESGIGWVPFLFERCDEHWERRPSEFPGITKAPSEYLAEGRLFVSTEGEAGIPQAIQQAGDRWIVWASDYPHWDSAFPDSVTHVTERDDIPAESLAAIFDTNPKRLYGW